MLWWNQSKMKYFHVSNIDSFKDFSDFISYLKCYQTKNRPLGSGCGSVGRAVTANSRGPRFESSHWQHFILNIYCQLYWKEENKVKEAENGPLKNGPAPNVIRWTKALWLVEIPIYLVMWLSNQFSLPGSV